MFRCSRECSVKKSSPLLSPLFKGWTLERHFGTQTGQNLEVAGLIWKDIFHWSSATCSVVRASVQGNLSSFPTWKRLIYVGMTSQPFVVEDRLNQRWFVNGMIYHGIREKRFFFVNSFGKVCLFRTGGEGHPTWILFNSCLGSSSDYGKICGVRENCKMQNTTPNPVIEAPPNLLQWPHPLKHSPENRDSSTSKLASRCYPSYPSAKKLGRGRPPFWSSKASCRLLWCRASEAWDASFCT